MSGKPTYEELENRVKELEKKMVDSQTMKEALWESKKKYYELVESLPAIVFEIVDGKIVDINETPLQSFGYSDKSEIIGKNAIDFIKSEEIERGERGIKRAFQGKKYRAVEYSFRTKGGAFIPVHVYANSLYKNDEVIGIRGIAVDISPIKQAEKALRDSEKHYRLLADNIIDAISILDLDSLRFSYVSPSIERITGYSDEEMTGRLLEDVLTPLSMEIVTRKILKELAADKTNSAKPLIMELEHYHKDGSTLWTEVSTRFMRDKEGHPDAIIGVTRDITERKLLESKLNQAQKMESIGILAGGIAHDFNNILTAIIGYTEIALEKTAPDSELQSFLQEIYNAGHRAKELVKHILAFARQSEQELKPTRVDLIVAEALKLIRSTLPTTIEIESYIKGEATVLADSIQIHQIIMNLCTNAAQAMEDSGGKLSVILSAVNLDSMGIASLIGLEPGNYLKLEIADTGIGMSRKIMDSIFDPYFTTKDVGEGTGLGLAVVHGFVKSHGGDIMVSSEVGKGSVFTVYLPIIESAEPSKSHDTASIPSGTEHILFVDDEACIAKMCEMMLNPLGYHITTRTSSLEALELFKHKANDFDLVITDMTMPKMTGDVLAGKMMEIRPDIPVILCTGYSKKMSDVKASQIGVKAFQMKPLIKKELATTIRKVLDEAKRSV